MLIRPTVHAFGRRPRPAPADRRKTRGTSFVPISPVSRTDHSSIVIGFYSPPPRSQFPNWAIVIIVNNNNAMSRFDSPPLRRPYSTFASAFVASRLCSWPKKDAGIPRRNSYVSSYYLVLSAILAFLNQQMIFISAEAAPAPFASIDHNTRRMQGTHHGQGPEKPTYCQRHRVRYQKFQAFLEFSGLAHCLLTRFMRAHS